MLDGGKTNTDGLSDPMLALHDFIFVLKSLEWGRILTARVIEHYLHLGFRGNNKTV